MISALFLVAVALAIAACSPGAIASPAPSVVGPSVGVPTAASLATPGAPVGKARLAAGWYHTCALISAGIKCWGHNGAGQLGEGGPIFAPDCGDECFGDILESPPEFGPYDVVGLDEGVTMVDGGWYQTCAVTSGGAARCWGYNEEAQLGSGSIEWSSRPLDVVGLGSSVVQVSTGYSTSCALSAAGEVRCWGYGVSGEDVVAEPVAMGDFGAKVVAIDVGNVMGCALTDAGAVKCWDTDGVDTPHALEGLEAGVVQISVGDLHACAVMAAGGARCWGGNFDGELGNGTTEDSVAPVDVAGIADAVAVSAGGIHTCAVTSGGGVKCWGANYYGSLGDGTTDDSPTPVDVSGIASGAVDVAAGAEHSCALLGDGTIKCWGSNFASQLGVSGLELEQSEIPVVVDLDPQ